jgi:hypothetical protein
VTTSGVATTLTNHGVRGYQTRTDDCPVARYLHAVMGGDQSVSRLEVGLDRVYVYSRRPWWPPVSAPIPLPVQQFIAAFDSGRFPHLRATEPAPRRRHHSER